MNPTSIDLGPLDFGGGGGILVRRALRLAEPGKSFMIEGSSPSLAIDLAAFCRSEGHGLTTADGLLALTPSRQRPRFERAEAESEDPPVHAKPRSTWGLAGRTANVETGGPSFEFPLSSRETVWSDEAAQLYAQAVASQWDPNRAIDWEADVDLPGELEDATVAIMTYLIENETAALLIPARFVGQLHPHFREVMQLLAIQTADEARHIEVFTRRALLRRDRLGSSTIGGQTSLKSLLDEPDFSIAMFLLSVLGEGTFLSLLWFLRENGADPVTRQIATLTAQDEARHVAFGLSHLKRHLTHDPSLRTRLANAVDKRHAQLSAGAGLNQEVFDALVIVAAGSLEPSALALGFEKTQDLLHDMDRGRRLRLMKLGFSPDEAEGLSSLHTRNFM